MAFKRSGVQVPYPPLSFESTDDFSRGEHLGDRLARIFDARRSVSNCVYRSAVCVTVRVLILLGLPFCGLTIVSDSSQAAEPDGAQQVASQLDDLNQASKSNRNLSDQRISQGRIIVKYDISGAEEDGKISVQHIGGRDVIGTVEAYGLKFIPLKIGGKLDIKNLIAGDYQVGRHRQVEIDPSRISRGLLLDRQPFKLGAQETKSIEFVRPNGKAVSGRVVNMKDVGRGKVVFYACSNNARDAESLSNLEVTVFDARNCDADGAFRTEPLSPGKYVILVEAYQPLTPEQLRQSGGIRPRFVGAVHITVPETGEPPAVEVTLKEK